MTVIATVRVRTLPELQGLVTGVALASWTQLNDPRTARMIPKLYSGHVRYRQERPGLEEWQTALETAQRGWGDCEDLVIYRLAELWQGEDVRARARVIQVTPALRHVVLVRGNGHIEDPSKRLGMRG
jgi:hypothetical protein